MVVGNNSNRRQVAAAVKALQEDQAVVAAATLTGNTFLGAPVYRKVLTVAAGPNNATVNTAHGISSPVRFVGVKVMLKNGSDVHLCFDGGGFLGATTATSIQVAIDGTNIGLTSGSGGDFSGYAGYIELLYTLA